MKPTKLSLALFAVLSVGILAPAQAQITTPKVTIICSAMCQQRKTMDTMQEWNDLESYMRGLYSSRHQWNEFTDDPTWFNPGISLDLRCNVAAKNAVGNVTASSLPQDQKTGAEEALKVLKAAMGGSFSAFVSGLGTSSGVYAVSGASFPSTTKIISFAWKDGTQSNWSLVMTGSGWAIGQLINTQPKPAGETDQCPA